MDRKYVKSHNTLELDITNEEYKNKIEKIYNRTILLYPLLTNETTGGIQAAVEVDEKLDKCGRYAYCWTRDAAFITKALDIQFEMLCDEKGYDKSAVESRYILMDNNDKRHLYNNRGNYHIHILLNLLYYS